MTMAINHSIALAFHIVPWSFLPAIHHFFPNIECNAALWLGTLKLREPQDNKWGGVYRYLCAFNKWFHLI